MDFYKIAALKVFSGLGQLIEDDDMRRDAPASLDRLVPCAADDSKNYIIVYIIYIYKKWIFTKSPL